MVKLMAEMLRKNHRWSRAEYERMVEAGVFASNSRLELLDGEIIDMTPQGSAHVTAVHLIAEVLRNVFGPGHMVRNQAPVAVDHVSEPEPDVAVVPGTPRDYRNAHPQTALLIVEVADSSLGFDRVRKKRIYARNDIAEYWILDLQARCLEVYRDPEGEDYRSKSTLGENDTIMPLARPDAVVAVADLLP